MRYSTSLVTLLAPTSAAWPANYGPRPANVGQRERPVASLGLRRRRPLAVTDFGLKGVRARCEAAGDESPWKWHIAQAPALGSSG